MSENVPHLVAADTNNVRGVLVPCEPAQFSGFIASILGKKQIIEQKLSGAFKEETGHIQNYNHLLEQRVQTQNRDTLVAFSGTITLDNGATVVLNSMRDFDAFYPVGSSITEGVNLNWTYLIHFPTQRIPEVQEINISINTGRMRRKGSESRSDDLDEAESENLEGSIICRIAHTNRTWAIDILNLLITHARASMQPRSTLRDSIYKWKRSISIGLILLTGIAFLFAIESVSSIVRMGKISEFQSKIAALPSDLDGIKKSIAYLGASIDVLSSRNVDMVFGLAVMLLGPIMVGLLFLPDRLLRRQASYIILTDRDQTFRLQDKRRFERNFS
jgi:hypothetical protein